MVEAVFILPDYAAAITIFRSVISLLLIMTMNKLSNTLSGISIW